MLLIIVGEHVGFVLIIGSKEMLFCIIYPFPGCVYYITGNYSVFFFLLIYTLASGLFTFFIESN